MFHHGQGGNADNGTAPCDEMTRGREPLTGFDPDRRLRDPGGGPRETLTRPVRAHQVS
ncbi:hypothetical protein ABIB80_007097 [Bradyrhizobium sp. i1.15.2]